MEKKEKQNTLFIICPFCQLENFLRKRFGDDIFFITAPAAVLNFSEDEVYAIKDFLVRENIKNIYLVNDVSCNFIEGAINHKKEFGLHCEKELRRLLQNSKIESHYSLEAKKQLLAQNNVSKQLQYLNTEKILKQEIEILEIKIHGLISDKHNTNNSIIQNSK